MNPNFNTNFKISEEERISKSIEILHTLGRVKSSIDFLEIGCLNGNFISKLPKEWRSVGVDIQNIEPKICEFEFVQLDVEKGLNKSLDNRKFDLIFAGEIIEHIHDTETFMKECFEALKQGGSLVLTTPNTSYWGNVIQIIREKPLHSIDWKNGQNNHVRYFAPKTLAEELKKIGFKNITIDSVGTNTYTPKGFGTVLNLIIWLLNSIKKNGRNIIVTATK